MAITALNLWDKLFNCCTRAQYRFTDDDLDDEYTEKVNKGVGVGWVWVAEPVSLLCKLSPCRSPA